VRNAEVLHRVKEERNILQTIKRRKANWIVHNLCRNCLLKHVTEGKTEGRIQVTGRRGRRRNQLPNNLNETTGCVREIEREGTSSTSVENSLPKKL
jgi:hypothetical protein